jgi:uncharacterized protein
MKKYLIIISIALLPFAGLAQSTQSNNSLRVEGIFTAKEKPERIDFSISIRNSCLEFRQCSDSLLVMLREMTDILVNNGISKQVIRIADMSVTENFEYDAGGRRRVGFIGTARLEIQDTLSPAFNERIFRSIGQFRYDISYHARFSLSEQQRERLRQLSLEQAIEDARQKAEIIAQKAGVQLIRINRITVSESEPGIMPRFDMAMEKEFASSRPENFYQDIEFNPVEISISRNVVIEWIIRE